MNSRFVIGVIVLLFSQARLFSVSPLVVDNADTTEAGHLQLNPNFQFTRTGSVSLYSTPINPVVGLSPSAELGVVFGYQRRDGSGSTPTIADAQGITDLVIAPKWRLWGGPEDKLKFSGRLDLKLPTASGKRGLGSGDTDAGLVGIATYRFGKTNFDCNLGYYGIDVSRAHSDDDRWFIGQAARHEVNKSWTIVAETYALLPNTGPAETPIFTLMAAHNGTLANM
jgi:outer membrane putative beta-barrel porin/alpha-amylase